MAEQNANRFFAESAGGDGLKFQEHVQIPDVPVAITPMGRIGRYWVRPGRFEVHGATAVAGGVNFTVHTHFGTSCELLLFHKDQDEPFDILRFPREYRIGDVYSMIVFGLNIEEFEYAYRIDGPWDPQDRKSVV